VNAAIRPRARDDIIRQFRWYLVRQEAPKAAFRFLDAVEEAVLQLLGMPEIGAIKKLRHPALKGLRSWPVPGFEDIRVYYLVRGDVLNVIRKRDIERTLEAEPDWR
jgi:toxin ParE1/3/4